MKPTFQLGDEIQLLNAREKGIVIGYHDANHLIVDIDGMEQVLHVDEVVLLKKKTIQAPSTHSHTITPQTNLTNDLYIAIHLRTENVLQLHLFNAHNATLYFAVIQQMKNLQPQALIDGSLKPFHTTLLLTTTLSDFTQKAHLQLHGLLHYPNAPEKTHTFSYTFVPDKKQLQRKTTFLNPLQAEAILIPLAKNQEKQNTLPLPPTITKINPSIPHKELQFFEEYLEFDLHIDKLFPKNPPKPEECLAIQLKKAEQFLSDAIQKQAKAVVFIHGGGKGTLKEQLILLFQNHPYVSHHEPADIQKFGLGATVFHIKY